MRKASILDSDCLIGESLRRVVPLEATSSGVHLLQDLEGVPTSLHTKADEGLALLKHLRPDSNCVKRLGL